MKNILVVLLMFLSYRAVAQEASLQFGQANELYRAGNFENAAELYEQILSNGYESPPLYYNLGNANFKLNKFPAAILNYERAKRLAPHDDDIGYNLRLANLHIIDKIDPIPRLFLIEWLRSFINLASASQWALAVIVTMWGVGLCAAMFWLVRSAVIQKITFIVGLFFLLTASVGYLGMFQQMSRERNEQAAIVFTATVTVKSSPDDKSTELFVLHEGVKLEVLDEIGEWRKIRLPDGKIGWMPAQDMQVI